MDVEEAMLRGFIRRERVERYVALLKTRRRGKIIGELDHRIALDGRWMWPVDKVDQSPGGVYKLLRGRGAPDDCYVMSSGMLDEREMPLREALDAVVCTGTGTLISCIPGQLAYYEGEEMTERYILDRPAR